MQCNYSCPCINAAKPSQNHLITKSSQCQCEEHAPQLKRRSIIAQLPTAAEQEDLDYHAKLTVSNEGGLSVLTMSRVLKRDALVSAV
jgi:hypothetical protein